MADSDRARMGEGGAGLPPALRLQVLATEHWSLLASRSLAWNEAFSRAGMFLSTFSAALVALALVAQASAPAGAFVIFALVVLPVVLFVGIATFLRIGAANYHDALCVVGMNRIRGAYLELDPEVARYFVMSAHDDPRGVGITMAVEPGAGGLAHLLAATPTLVSVLNAALVGTIAALVAGQAGAPVQAAAGTGAAGFLAAVAAHGWYGQRRIERLQRSLRPLFPSPSE